MFAMSNVDYIISCRVADASYIVPGSLTGKCANCGEVVLISPSSLEIRQANPGSQFLCIQCGLAQIEKMGGEFIGFTPAQAAEIEKYRRRRRNGRTIPWGD